MAENSKLYAILDFARMGQFADEALRLNPDYTCLYDTNLKNHLKSVAPYLFSFDPQSDFGKWFLTKGKGQHWGILFQSSAKPEIIWKHFRKYIIVQSESGEEMYFRYYDPRVLQVFLPTCTNSQIDEIFGPVDSFFTEDKEFFNDLNTNNSENSKGFLTRYTRSKTEETTSTNPDFPQNLSITSSVELPEINHSTKSDEPAHPLAEIEATSSKAARSAPPPSDYELREYKDHLNALQRSAHGGTGFITICRQHNWNEGGFDPNKIQTLFYFFSSYGQSIPPNFFPSDAAFVADFISRHGVEEA